MKLWKEGRNEGMKQWRNEEMKEEMQEGMKEGNKNKEYLVELQHERIEYVDLIRLPIWKWLQESNHIKRKKQMKEETKIEEKMKLWTKIISNQE